MTRLAALFAIDLRSLAAFRIGLAISSLYALIILAPDLGAFFTSEGLTPADMSAPHAYRAKFALLTWLDGYGWAAAVWAIGVAASTALLLGWRTRTAALAAWIAWLALISRNGFIVLGGDHLLLLLMFWAMFLPVAGRFSIDHALDPAATRNAPESVTSVATVGVLLQVLYVYVFGALLKIGDAWWPNGSAIYLALHLDTFVTDFGVWFRQFALPMQLLTFFVFAIELWAPLLLFFPDRGMRLRKATLFLLICMHLGFRVFLRIGHFWMVSLSSLALYAPADWWAWISRRYWREEQRRIEIWYDRDCGFCLKTALILREFFLPEGVSVRPAQEHPEYGPILEREVSWIVVAPDGARRLHWDAVVYVMSQSVLLKPFGWLAALYGAIGLGRPTYDLIGRSRARLGLATRLLTPASARPRPLGAPTAVFLCLVIAAVFFWNMRHVSPRVDEAFPAALEQSMFRIGLNQKWGMFAPTPPTDDGYPEVVALTPAPGDLNLWARPHAGIGPPERWFDPFPSHRWRKYLNNLRILDEESRAPYLRRYADYACRAARVEYGEGVAGVRFTLRMNRTRGGFGSEDYSTDWGDWPCAEG